MCLAVPVLITEIENEEATVEIGGISRRISIYLTPEAGVGDYVLVHAGYAINIVEPEEAEETLRLFQEMAEAEQIQDRK
jgi:hydrogenase expression/formation protein HypC